MATNSNIIKNLCNYELSDSKRFVLSHGQKLRLPSTNRKHKGIFKEFETLMGQLFHHKLKSKEQLGSLKAKLSNLAHSFCGTLVDLSNFTVYRKFSHSIKTFYQQEYSDNST